MAEGPGKVKWRKGFGTGKFLKNFKAWGRFRPTGSCAREALAKAADRIGAGAHPRSLFAADRAGVKARRMSFVAMLAGRMRRRRLRPSRLGSLLGRAYSGGAFSTFSRALYCAVRQAIAPAPACPPHRFMRAARNARWPPRTGNRAASESASRSLAA